MFYNKKNEFLDLCFLSIKKKTKDTFKQCAFDFKKN